MRNFDYSFLEHGTLPAKFVNIVGRIMELKERVNEHKNKKKFEKVFTRLESEAKIQSVKCANMLADIPVPDNCINAPIKNNNADAEVSGYRDALALVCDEYANLDICGSDILRIYKTLRKYSSGRNDYMKNSIPIKEKGALLKIEPVRKVIERLMFTYTAAQNNININQLLLIPCVIIDFLCICPFESGNGRMSQLLSQLLLYKNGFDVVRYISFEEQISRNKSMYDETLEKSLAGWDSGEQNDYIPFMEYFINIVLSCYTALDGHFPSANRSTITKRQQIEELVLNSKEPISKSDILRKLSDVSQQTIEVELGKMVKSGLIEKVGSARNTKYIKK